MDLTRCEVNVNNVQNLPDTPAISASELKQTFDKTGKDLKDFINNTMLPEMEDGVSKSEEKTSKKIINTSKFNVKPATDIQANVDYTVPTTYEVNASALDVFFEGCLLNINEHYTERGTGNSNKIRFTFTVPKNSLLSFIVRKKG